MRDICIFTNTLTEGGAERQIIFLANELSIYYRISIIVLYGDRISPNYISKISNSKNIDVFLLDGLSIKGLYKYYSLLKKIKPIVVFNYLLIPNLVGGFIAQAAGIKYTIGGIRNAYLEKKKVFFNRIAHNYINYLTIYNNYAGLKYYTSHGFKEAKAIYIPNMISIEEDNSITKEKPEEESRIPTILSVGRFTEAKDPETAINVIKQLYINGYSFKYIICGWGKLEDYIRNKIKEDGVEHLVEIVISPTNVFDYYRKADIYLQTSLYEGLSNTVMEAMKYGLACVVTDVGDNNILIENKINGFICKPKDIKCIVEKIESLLNNSFEIVEIGKKNKEKIAGHYGKEIFLERYLSLIKKLYGEE